MYFYVELFLVHKNMFVDLFTMVYRFMLKIQYNAVCSNAVSVVLRVFILNYFFTK